MVAVVQANNFIYFTIAFTDSAKKTCNRASTSGGNVLPKEHVAVNEAVCACEKQLAKEKM